jgi:molybdopterin-synthase adenylyltransferase
MLKPRIKEMHRPMRLPGGRMWIGSAHYGLGSELTGDDVELTWDLCQAMDGSLTQDELITVVTSSHAADRSIAERIVKLLIASGWVEDAGAPVPSALTDRDVERYRTSSQFFSWIDQFPRSSPYELQAKLKASRVTVLGVGGTGSAVATSLAASGIGHLHLVDGDEIELSNLSRQVLYTEDDIGKSKSDTAVRRLAALNGDIEITGSNAFLENPSDIRREVAGSDIFVHCVDSPAEVYEWSTSVSFELRIPWVLGVYTGPMAAIGTFMPGETGCYQCITDAEDNRARAEGTQELITRRRPEGCNPVLSPTAQISGHLAALETIYYLLGMNVQTAGRQFHHDFLDYEHHYYLGLGYSSECPHQATGSH